MQEENEDFVKKYFCKKFTLIIHDDIWKNSNDIIVMIYLKSPAHQDGAGRVRNGGIFKC